MPEHSHCAHCGWEVSPTDKPHKRIYAAFEKAAVSSIATTAIVLLLKALGI